MEHFTDGVEAIRSVPIEQMNALIAIAALVVAGFALYVALVVVRGRRK